MASEAASNTESKNLTFHIIGDAFVDFFCFLDGAWPENGGDSRLDQPVKTYAGGSSTNTATHLQSLFTKTRDNSTESQEKVVLHTVLNPDDHYGQLLTEHAAQHTIDLVNCRRGQDTSSTGHCIAIVSGGERSFMTHQGCIENFTADMLDVDSIIASAGPVHVHVAGYFNVTGFWHGGLELQLARIRRERDAKFPSLSTTISLVTQHDASKEWDGGLDSLVPYLDFLVMNELEASRIVRRGSAKDSFPNPTTTQDENEIIAEWLEFFTPLSPHTCIIVTRGADGAVAFRGGQIVAKINPAIKVPVIDPTGAGDSFTAGFIYGMWKARLYRLDDNEQLWPCRTIEEGLMWGCAVGTNAVTIRGASNPSEMAPIIDLMERQRAKVL